MIYIKDLMSGLDIFKALGSEIRIQILELLAYQGQSMNDIANKLNLSNGTITMHIRKLEECVLCGDQYRERQARHPKNVLFEQG